MTLPELPAIDLPSAVADPGWPPQVDYAVNPRVNVAGYIIDWSWDKATEVEKDIITRWAARIESSGFGIDLSWGAEVLKNASAQLSQPVTALMEDESGVFSVVEAGAGKVSVRHGVADTDPIAARLANADAAALLPVAMSARHYAAAGIENVESGYYFPEWLLDEIEAEATRTDRSLSHTVQSAWRLGGAKVHADPEAVGKALREAAPEAEGMPRRREQILSVPTPMLAQIESEAARQDRSRSWVVSAAWVAVRNELAARPAR